VNESKLAVPFVTSSLDPEVVSKAQRRKFSAADKKRILDEVDRATGHGAIGAILRPERNPLAGENEKLRRQNQRLQEELEKAHIVIDVQKKVARLLGYPLAEVPGAEK
jgi:transposase